jgi:hypothetical protein
MLVRSARHILQSRRASSLCVSLASTSDRDSADFLSLLSNNLRSAADTLQIVTAADNGGTPSPATPPHATVPHPPPIVSQASSSTTTSGSDKSRAWMAPANLTPSQVVEALGAHIIGQEPAKRAIAVALRNRWRRMQLPSAQQDEIIPKNILMVRVLYYYAT